ncbi:hypothetical protein R5R35_011195 [Gryllus longicercus]|uniref:Uncharacterized protein n=1 Tax=Gryllus longicercus TaxID=2509291 RepID=A0AAN9Z532_9ORTH
MQESGRGLQLAGTEEGGGGHPPATRSGAGGAGGGESARAAHPCGGGGQPATRAGRHMLQAGVLWWQEEKLIRRRGAQAGWFVACCERGALNCVIDAIGVLGRWQHTHTRERRRRDNGCHTCRAHRGSLLRMEVSRNFACSCLASVARWCEGNSE